MSNVNCSKVNSILFILMTFSAYRDKKAVTFYLGYLSADNNADYFAKAVASTLRGIVKSSEDRLARMQFKEAVELAKIVQMIAPLCEIDDDELRRLHVKCVDEVKHINGILKLENVVRGE